MKHTNLVNHKIAVAGASGFVGSYLTKFLRFYSNEVFELVRTVADKPISPEEIEIGDILKRNTYRGVFEGIDTVIYTIGRTHHTNEDDADFEVIYKEINCDAMIRMAKAAQSQGIKRFIFLSSLKAIGDNTVEHTPFSKDSIPEPNGPYGRSKLIAERELLELSSSTGLEVVIIRPPLIYGPGVKGNLRSIINAARLKIPLPLRWVSKNSRSMVSLENLCLLIKECIVNPEAANNTFFVKDQLDLSTVEIVRLLTKNEGLNPILFPFPESLMRLLFFMINKPWISERLFGDLTVDDAFTRETLDWSPNKNQDEMVNNK